MRLSKLLSPPPLRRANCVTPTWAGQTQPLAEAGFETPSLGALHWRTGALGHRGSNGIELNVKSGIVRVRPREAFRRRKGATACESGSSWKQKGNQAPLPQRMFGQDTAKRKCVSPVPFQPICREDIWLSCPAGTPESQTATERGKEEEEEKKKKEYQFQI